MEFFSRDPDKQLVEVKEALVKRLTTLRSRQEDWDCETSFDDRSAGFTDGKVSQAFDECEFLANLLDQMERS